LLEDIAVYRRATTSLSALFSAFITLCIIGCGQKTNSIVAADSHATILYTENGGDSWASYTTELATSLQSIGIIGLGTMTAVGNAGSILLTTDGGNHWTTQSSPSTTLLKDIVTTGIVNEGIITGIQGTILRTTNAGAEWSVVTSPTTASLNSVTFQIGRKGLIVGDFNTILRSTDRGNSWTSVHSGGFDSFNDVAFFGQTDTALVVGSGGIVLRSTDAGLHWDSIATGIKADLNAVTIIAPRTAIAVGRYDAAKGSQVFKSTDGGRTWSPRPCGLSDFHVLNDVTTVDEGVELCIAVGTRQRVLRSTDQGESWTVDAAQPTTSNLNKALLYGYDFGEIVGD
jgi:photosystem II stability/assembly factor-like uncharacterized protein